MKILQVAPRYAPHTGGVETHVAEISRRLVALGHDVTVFTADAEADLPRRETREGVRVRRFRGFAPGGAFHVAPGVAPAVRRADPDVVHAHNYHSLPAFFAALGVAVGGSAGPEDARFVVTPHYHGASASDFRDRLLSLYRPLGGWALDRADEVIAVSDWERDRLRSDFGVEATVIPNGLNAERFADATPEERDRPYLLCVGRLEAYKGVQHAIRALSELPEYDLLVAGSGDYREELEAVARREGVASRVEFLGYVADERLPGLYAGASAYLTLSTFEAYGMTVAEALAAGTPCVVREAGALVDWADRPDCESVAAIAPETVAEAVRNAVGRDAPAAALPTWDDVADRVLTRYE
ncbi:glycosyltransferase family 4 protein [Halorussus gelatinilyticus]|uniref:Glycosyltransferase family 4 protein n=1 Tax=Halorussus gelatinilyticus TaxID=2937524 RepID=A0A8U0IJ58_9EURY|nr:glycosyltransferase family 4 protein [Halorussus gelatinilyticus]UPW00322.1 glycosyltransferase family 4 protein [Halorussus gelatinilyticus]